MRRMFGVCAELAARRSELAHVSVGVRTSSALVGVRAASVAAIGGGGFVLEIDRQIVSGVDDDMVAPSW